MEGFHANYKDLCERFMSDSNYLIVMENDTDYLGKGMYFWEHHSDAVWWRTKKTERESAIVSAELLQNKMLDLTDDEVNDKLQRMFCCLDHRIKNRYQSKYKDKDLNTSVGMKIDSLFEAYTGMSDSYDIVKGCKKYNKQESEFLEGTQLTTKNVVFYCVRNINPVGERKWVEQ